MPVRAAAAALAVLAQLDRVVEQSRTPRLPRPRGRPAPGLVTSAPGVLLFGDEADHHRDGWGMTTKIAKRGTCAFCTTTDVMLTIEHVFPQSWYPDAFAAADMLTVPACSPCNHRSGQIEGRLFYHWRCRYRMTNGPRTLSSERAAALTQAQRDRLVIPHTGGKKGTSFLKRVGFVGPEATPPAMWTSAGRFPDQMQRLADAGHGLPGVPTVQFRWEDLEALAVKLLKGCYFATHDLPLPADASFWAVGYDVDPRELFDEWTRTPGCVQRGAFPFRFSIATLQSIIGAAGAFFQLWDHHFVFAASNLPRSG